MDVDDTVMLGLLHETYGLLRGLIRSCAVDWDDPQCQTVSDLYERIGDFLWPDGGQRPEVRLGLLDSCGFSGS